MDINEAIRIHKENIEEFSRRGRISEAQRRGTVEELSKLVAESAPEREAAGAYRRFCHTLSSATSEDKARVCMMLGASQRYGAQMWEKTFYGEPITAGSHGRVSIVRNRYNEQAFSCFSKVITRPKEQIAPSFAAACEDVRDNRSEFCILPVENAQSGRLFGFYSMLDRYELRICAVCESETEGAESGARYALVGRSIPDRIPKSAEWSFEFSVTTDSARLLVDISVAADTFGARLAKIDSLPVEYDSGVQKFYFTFDLTETSISAFELYLSEEYAGYSVIGAYPKIK